MTNHEKEIRRQWLEFKKKTGKIKEEKIFVTKENIDTICSQIFK